MKRQSAVADPGFLRRGVPTSKMGPKIYYFVKFSRQTTRKRNNLDPEEGTRPWRPPRSANDQANLSTEKAQIPVT